MTTFTTTLLAAGKTATGISVPPEIVESFGAGRQPSVLVTINGHTYQSTVAVRGERYLVSVSAENRGLAGVAAGDEIEVTLALDTESRELAVPEDFARALDAEAQARAFFDGLSFSQRQWFVLGIEEAKTPETRDRRIDKAVARLLEGRGVR